MINDAASISVQEISDVQTASPVADTGIAGYDEDEEMKDEQQATMDEIAHDVGRTGKFEETENVRGVDTIVEIANSSSANVVVQDSDAGTKNEQHVSGDAALLSQDSAPIAVQTNESGTEESSNFD